MGLTLSIFEITFAALCMWLGVRIYNRRERWAKRALIVTVALPALYVATFGPACWLCQQWLLSPRAVWIVYRPLTWLAVRGNEPISSAIRRYASVCGDKHEISASHLRGVVRYWSKSPSPIVYEVLLSKYELLFAKQSLQQRGSAMQMWRQHQVVFDSSGRF
jgi:hypothetical protein